MKSPFSRSAVCLICVFAWMLSLSTFVFAQEKETRTITDMAGRIVVIPEHSRRVLSRSPIGTVLMYTLNPGKIAGQNWQPTASEKKYLDPEFLSLPVLSGWYADGKVGNVEEIIEASPDFILFAFFGKKPKAGVLDQAERIEQQLRIPVVMVKGNLDSLPMTYVFVGNLIDEEARGAKLAEYAADLLADARNRAESIEPDQRVRLYYAEGVEGLQTDPAGSWHTTVIDYVAARNIAEVEVKTMMGRATVSPEQLLQWNPQVIIACHDQGFSQETSTYSVVVNDDRFKTVDAITAGKVYEIPYQPFNFLDRPPSANRLIGIRWLGNLLYPKIFDYDIKADTKEFYRLFYRIELSDAQLQEIFQRSKAVL